MRVLIVDDGEQKGTVSAVRALAEAGHHVGIADPLKGHGARSRYCRDWHRIPLLGDASLIATISETVHSHGYEVIFTGTDEHLLVLSNARDELGALFPYAPHDVVEAVKDKMALTSAATSAGLSAPLTGADPGDIPDTRVIVKERLHSGLQKEGSFKPEFVMDPPEARRLFAELGRVGHHPIWQEYVEGRLMAVVVLCDVGGEVLYSAQQVASHTYPPGLGGSCRAEIVRSDHTMEDALASFLKRIGWWGLAQIQFVLTADGDAFLIDLNGRFYGSMNLVLRAGSNLPAAWLGVATGTPYPDLAPARIGARYQWLEGDLRRSLVERRGGLIRDAAGCLGYSIGAQHSMWRLDDPVPSFRFAGRLLAKGVRKALSRR